MIVRSLDTNGDWRLGKGKQSYLNLQKAISQNIKTRLSSFLNDCFFDMESGIDWIRLLGTRNTENEIVLSCRTIILSTEGVLRINEFSVSTSGRQITLQYNVDTIYSKQYQETLQVTE